MRRLRILDVYCGAGGASRGYSLAGFEVYGVDIADQPRYPYPFHRGDAIGVLRALLAGERLPFVSMGGLRTVQLGLNDFDAIAASPPCQRYSITRHTHSIEHPDLVDPTRELLQQTGLPYVMENVVGAPLIDPILLCGGMFELRAEDTDGTMLRLERHRLFESNRPLSAPAHPTHDRSVKVGGVYGGGGSRRDSKRRGGYTPLKVVRAALMGIDWMTQDELSQSIPPAYTEFIGDQLYNMIGERP